jgi:hypothetical protein
MRFLESRLEPVFFEKKDLDLPFTAEFEVLSFGNEDVPVSGELSGGHVSLVAQLQASPTSPSPGVPRAKKDLPNSGGSLMID